jgi:hypothetical protein
MLQAEDFSYALNDLLICVEMFIFALLHHFIFSYKEFASDQNAAAWSQI